MRSHGPSEKLCRKKHPECQGSPAEEIATDQSRTGDLRCGLECFAKDQAKETAGNGINHSDVSHVIVIHAK